MSEADVELVTGTLALFSEGRREEAYARLAQDVVGETPPEWPEPGPYEGRAGIRQMFGAWDAAFGRDWPTQLFIDRVTDVGDGRVLLEFTLDTRGAASGLPLDQPLAGIYTVREEQIVHAQFYIGRDQARRDAGLEEQE